jgi:tetratricopeptide (TPR) repeat protein
MRQRKLARKVAITSMFALGVALLALAFAGYFLRDYLRSARSQLVQAELNVSNEIYDAAIQDYEDLIDNSRRSWILKNTPPYKDVNEEILKVKQLQVQYDSVSLHLQQSDSLSFQGDYAGALHAYRDAQLALLQYKVMNYQLSTEKDSGRIWRVDSARIEQKYLDLTRRVINLRETLVRNFEISQRNFEVFKEAKVWGQAIRNLEKMKRLLPKESEDMQVLQDALVLNESPAGFVDRELRQARRMLGQ